MSLPGIANAFAAANNSFSQFQDDALRLTELSHAQLLQQAAAGYGFVPFRKRESPYKRKLAEGLHQQRSLSISESVENRQPLVLPPRQSFDAQVSAAATSVISNLGYYYPQVLPNTPVKWRENDISIRRGRGWQKLLPQISRQLPQIQNTTRSFGQSPPAAAAAGILAIQSKTATIKENSVIPRKCVDFTELKKRLKDEMKKWKEEEAAVESSSSSSSSNNSNVKHSQVQQLSKQHEEKQKQTIVQREPVMQLPLPKEFRLLNHHAQEHQKSKSPSDKENSIEHSNLLRDIHNESKQITTVIRNQQSRYLQLQGRSLYKHPPQYKTTPIYESLYPASIHIEPPSSLHQQQHPQQLHLQQQHPKQEHSQLQQPLPQEKSSSLQHSPAKRKEVRWDSTRFPIIKLYGLEQEDNRWSQVTSQTVPIRQPPTVVIPLQDSNKSNLTFRSFQPWYDPQQFGKHSNFISNRQPSINSTMQGSTSLTNGGYQFIDQSQSGLQATAIATAAHTYEVFPEQQEKKGLHQSQFSDFGIEDYFSLKGDQKSSDHRRQASLIAVDKEYQ